MNREFGRTEVCSCMLPVAGGGKESYVYVFVTNSTRSLNSDGIASEVLLVSSGAGLN